MLEKLATLFFLFSSVASLSWSTFFSCLCYPLFLLIPIVQSQVGRLGLRTAIPSTIHILDIEHKALDLWEGPSRNTDVSKEEI